MRLLKQTSPNLGEWSFWKVMVRGCESIEVDFSAPDRETHRRLRLERRRRQAEAEARLPHVRHGSAGLPARVLRPQGREARVRCIPGDLRNEQALLSRGYGRRPNVVRHLLSESVQLLAAVAWSGTEIWFRFGEALHLIERLFSQTVRIKLDSAQLRIFLI